MFEKLYKINEVKEVIKIVSLIKSWKIFWVLPFRIAIGIIDFLSQFCKKLKNVLGVVDINKRHLYILLLQEYH